MYVSEETLSSQQYVSIFSHPLNNAAYQGILFCFSYVVLDVLFLHMKMLPDEIFNEVCIDLANHVAIIKPSTNMIYIRFKIVQSQECLSCITAQIARLHLDFGSTGSFARGDSTAHSTGALFRLWKSLHQGGIVCMNHPNAVLLECRFSIEPAGCRYDEMEMEGTDCAK